MASGDYFNFGTGGKKKSKKSFLPSTSSQRRLFPLETSSDETYNTILGSLQSIQRTKKGLEALKSKKTGKPRQGILSKVFDQRTGAVSAPFRFTTALIADTLGYEDKDGKLSEQGPYSSAVRSFMGDFAITGGDIVKVNDDDPFLERMAKYAGALAIDVTADPINWFGGVGTFSRKGISIMAVRQGENMLDDAVRILSTKGNDSVKLLDNLFDESRLVQAAKKQAGELGPEDKKLLDAITDFLPDAKRQAQRGTPLDLLKVGPDGVVDPAVKKRIAGFEFGNKIGEAFYKSGRPGVRQVAESIFKDADLVDDFMRSLPQELSGGFFFKNPITGKPIARISGGLGKGGKVVQTLNEARFGITASRPVRFLPSQFSGQTGITFGAVKKGLIGNYAGVDRTKLLDFVTFKSAIQGRNANLLRMGIKAKAVASNALAIANGIKDEAGKAEYDSALKTYFFSPSTPVKVESEIATKAAGSANDLRNAIDEAYNELKALGIEVGDRGPEWTMLRLTDEEYKKIAEFGYLRGGVDAENVYRPNKGRDKWVEIHPDPEVRKAMGFEDPKFPGIVFLNALTVNARLQKKIYEEDPIKLVIDYLNWANSTIAARRFTDAAAATGAILRFPRETREILSQHSAKSFMNAAQKAGASAAAKARFILEKQQEEFKNAVNEDTLRAAQVEVSTRRNEALGEYSLAKDYEITARGALREADAAVANAEPTLMAVVQRLREYGKSGSEQTLQATKRLLDNAMSRRSRAARLREQALSEGANARLAMEEVGPTQELLDESAAMYDKAAQQSAKLEMEEVTVQSARQEVESAKILAKDLSERLGAEQLQEFNTYQLALKNQEEAAVAFEAARQKRIAALNEYRVAASDTTLQRVKAIDLEVNKYMTAKKEYFSFREQTAMRKFADLTVSEQQVYRELKEAYESARKELFENLGYSTRKNAPGVGKAYARMIVDLANKLTEDELVAARTIANAERLDELVRQFDPLNRDAALGIVGDIYKTYQRLREVMTPEDLSNLSKSERAILSSRKLKDLKEKVSAVPEAAKAMMAGAEKAGVKSRFGIRRVGAGVVNVDVNLPMSLRDTYAPEGIRDVLEDMYRLESNPNAWSKFISNIYDPLSLVWKTAVTVGRGPAYTVTNLVGGLVNNYLGGISVKGHKISGTVLATAVSTIREISRDPKNQGKSYFELVQIAEKELADKLSAVKINGRPVVELFVEFLERGGHFSSDIFFQAEELRRVGINIATPLERRSGVQYQFSDVPSGKADSAYRKTVTFLLNNPVQRTLNDLAASSEIFLRFAAIVDGYAKYGDMDSAMDVMYMLHFDYQDLSAAEFSIKRFMPFYTWMRNNVPLQLRMAFLQTGKMSNLFAATEEAKEAFGVNGDMAWLNDYLPDYMEINNGFVSYLKFGGNHLALFPKLPINDVDQLFGVGYIGSIPVPVPRITSGFGNALGPAVRTPMEFFTQRNFQYGYEYDSFSEFTSKQLESTIPYIGTFAKVGSAVGLPVEKTPFIDLSAQKGKQVSNLMQLLFGAPFGATMYNERTLKGVTYGRSKQLSKELNQAASDAGVDIDWLRDQLEKGVSPEALARKIESGQGDIDRVARRKKLDELTGKTKKKKPKDYRDVMKELQRGD